MSALAKLCVRLGARVCGSDDLDSAVLTELNTLGIKTSVGVDYVALDKCDTFVYTIAVGAQNEVVEYAKRNGKRVYERAEFLGEISRHYERVIAISGTHGKTTTTAMLGKIFEAAGLDPTVHLGGDALDFGGNLRIGDKKYFITEACEFNRSMLALNPDCTVITNIERDHMDTYTDLADIEEAFYQFAENTKNVVIINGDKIPKKPLKNNAKLITFGRRNTNDYYYKNVSQSGGKFAFDCYYNGQKLGNIKLNILGEHNIENALACVAIARFLNISFCDIVTGIWEYSGVNRRLTLINCDNGITHYHDYAHHPTEIRATLNTLKLLNKNRIIAIFQPHTYSRTKALLCEFTECFYNADILYLLPTYAARENFILGGDSLDIFYGINGKQNCAYFSSFEGLKYELDKTLMKGDLVVWLGAGDIDKIAQKYFDSLKSPRA